MNIRPFKNGDKWILAYGVGPVEDNRITGSRLRGISRVTFEGCWCEEKQRWTGQSVFGKTFDSPEDALAYLGENRDLLESAPGP